MAGKLSKQEFNKELLEDYEAKMPKSGGTFTGAVKAHSNTDQSTAQVRNIITSPNDPSGGSHNDIWIKYKQ